MKLPDAGSMAFDVWLSPPHMMGGEAEAVAAVLASGWVAPEGPALTEFEHRLADFAGLSACTATVSGTAALHLALLVLDIGLGDTVVCASGTFAATANPIVYVGAQPLFIDNAAGTHQFDPDLLEAAIISGRNAGLQIRAAILPHLYGVGAPMDTARAICDRYGVWLIEDAAEAMGVQVAGQPAGSWGHLAAFSFNGNKIITTSGGGALLSQNRDWIARARYLATQARAPMAHYEHPEVGFNYRLSNVLAALGLVQLGHLPEFVRLRQAVNQAYRAALAGLPGFSVGPSDFSDQDTYWLTVVEVDAALAPLDRDGLLQHLQSQGIQARPVWKPLHLQPSFAGTRFLGPGHCVTQFARGLCLPSGSNLRSADLDRITAAIRQCWQS